jgi:hypothetical protein
MKPTGALEERPINFDQGALESAAGHDSSNQYGRLSRMCRGRSAKVALTATAMTPVSKSVHPVPDRTACARPASPAFTLR